MGKNSEWSICGSKCPAVCGKEPETCVEVCIEGCFCNKGYFLSATGECISEDQCQQSLCTAKNNSKWNICGSQCPAVCGEEPKSCAQVCVEGCFCMDGYISTGTGHCISEDQCKETEKEKACTAKKNSEFSRCGSPCPDVCGEDPKSCIAECAEGCFCKEGYILSAAGECISEDQCKQEQQGSCTAKKNSEWSICGSKCPAVCHKEPETCVEVCTEGCFCKKGYILSATGDCISEDLCKQEERGNCTFVKKNFEWITCGSKCPAVCGKEPEMCAEVCIEGCFCKEGYILSAAGKCISEDQCKEVEEKEKACTAKKNYEWSTCGSNCPAVCGQEPKICNLMCVEGCFCKEGYILSAAGECISEDQCKEEEERACTAK